MLDDVTTMTVTSGLPPSLLQPEKLPVSKPGLKTSWGHVDCAVALLLAVTVVVTVDTEVTVCVDGKGGGAGT